LRGAAGAAVGQVAGQPALRLRAARPQDDAGRAEDVPAAQEGPETSGPVPAEGGDAVRLAAAHQEPADRRAVDEGGPGAEGAAQDDQGGVEVKHRGASNARGPALTRPA